MNSDGLLALVVITALAFDFTNGFHDTANVVASSISTRALSPRAAVALASLLNFAGAFISLKVAATVATGIVETSAITQTVVFAGLVGAIAWNLVTWFYGLPSSSSHALIGGMIGAMLSSPRWSYRRSWRRFWHSSSQASRFCSRTTSWAAAGRAS